MSDDWRLRIELDGEEQARELADRLAKFDAGHDLATTYRDRVVVSRDGSEVFAYAQTREQADAAERAISSVAAEHGWPVRPELRRWHPAVEEWEDPDASADPAAEHAALVSRERAESEDQGFPDFEVRVRCPSREDAGRLAERLSSEGIPNVHRWHFVVVGAADEDTANALAERIRSEAPAGSEVTAETSTQEMAREAPNVRTPFHNPFAVFGGLGG